jgi:hypothetical protein
MPSHYGSKNGAKSTKSMPAKKKANGKKNGSKGTHKMPDGTVMTGKTHSKDSKPVKKKKANGKGKLTAAQKKLPMKLQKAIMNSKK